MSFKKDDVIIVDSKAALITRVGGDGTTADKTTVHYSFIDGNGHLKGSGHFPNWTQGIQHIDFAKVKTVVELPPDWQHLGTEYDTVKQKEREDFTKRFYDHAPERHPSYGAIQVSRVTGGSYLFGSPFTHRNFIKIAIFRAKKTRSHSNNQHSADNRSLIEISLSEAQWARVVASPGIGEGTPCTLNYVGGARMEDCPQQEEVKKFHTDIEIRVKKATEALTTACELADNLLQSNTATKKQRQEVLSQVQKAKMELQQNVPFVLEQLGERMDTIVEDGKTELESYQQHILLQKGWETIKLEETGNVPDHTQIHSGRTNESDKITVRLPDPDSPESK